MRITVRVAKRGAALDARQRDMIMGHAMLDAEAAVTKRTLVEVHRELGRVLQHPTGYYESRVVADLTSHPPAVHDSGVVYGPWLEGIGSRNATTRFKGYHTFRRIAQRMNGQVVSVVGPIMSRAVSRLNGG